MKKTAYFIIPGPAPSGVGRDSDWSGRCRSVRHRSFGHRTIGNTLSGDRECKTKIYRD